MVESRESSSTISTRAINAALNSDTTALVKWPELLRRWADIMHIKINQWLTGNDLEELARNLP